MTQKNGHQRKKKSGSTPASTEYREPTKRKKRHLTKAYKQRVLAELDEVQYGETGAYLRREGLYSSQIAKWRKQRAAGELGKLTPTKSKSVTDEATQRIAELERENEQLRSKLAQAETIIAVQKKLARTLDSIALSSGEK